MDRLIIPQDKTLGFIITDKPLMAFHQPELSDWICYLFGGVPGGGVEWRPLKGHEPCWFWRQMQYLCFGNRWLKKP